MEEGGIQYSHMHLMCMTNKSLYKIEPIDIDRKAEKVTPAAIIACSDDVEWFSTVSICFHLRITRNLQKYN